MSWITAHKTLLGFIVLLVFALSANALLYGSHAADEAHEAVATAGEAGHHHSPSADNHDENPDASHCCETPHGFDVTGGCSFSLSEWSLDATLGGSYPPYFLLDVFPERFIPPRHHA